MKITKTICKNFLRACTLVSLAMVLGSGPTLAQNNRNGTTLAAAKTIDICVVEGATVPTWKYSGVVSVWNEGVIDTIGFKMQDCIQNKPGTGQFKDVAGYCTTSFDPAIHEITAGTTLATASTFNYAILGLPLSGDIRNIARPTITNHSGHLGQAYGPEPKATWAGGVPPPCDQQNGCTYTQGYWGNKPDVTWPAAYSRTNPFFLASPVTWQGALDTSVAGGNGYYILAKQYIAAVLNVANGASVPSGVQDTLNQATAWFGLHYPSECGAGQCGVQKAWGGILDVYNNGKYPGGPGHCGDE